MYHNNSAQDVLQIQTEGSEDYAICLETLQKPVINVCKVGMHLGEIVSRK